MGNQNPFIKEGQIIQRPNKKGGKDNDMLSTTQKTKDSAKGSRKSKTQNTMSTIKRTKRQIIIYKPVHRKLSVSIELHVFDFPFYFP